MNLVETREPRTLEEMQSAWKARRAKEAATASQAANAAREKRASEMRAYDAVSAFIKGVNKESPPKSSVRRIQVITANYYGVTLNDILSRRRAANVVLPRQVAMYVAKTLTPLSLPQIGRQFANRDHTTIWHGVEKISGLLAKDEQLRSAVAAIGEEFIA